MKTILYVDCIMRQGSRTKQIADAFIKHLNPTYKLIHCELPKLNLQPLVNNFFEEREVLLRRNQTHHPRFDLAHQFASADEIIIAAPFWDLSFPALLKIYIENISVDSITFQSSNEGLKGLCKGKHLIFLTTRGGFYTQHPQEQAFPYLTSLTQFFEIEEFIGIAADGMDVEGFDATASLQSAIEKAIETAKTL